MNRYTNGALNTAREAMYWVAMCYYFLGITGFLFNGDRYIDLRPADALFMAILTDIFVLCGMPIFIILWATNIISISAWMFVVGLIGLFALPPVITYTFCEFVLWRHLHRGNDNGSDKTL